MRSALLGGLLAICACRAETPTASDTFLFVWAGDSARKSSDFLAVIDAAPASPRYGAVVASREIGEVGTHPHHTEGELAANGHLLANGYHAGRTWLYDLSTPLEPKILTSFEDVAGFSHPHSFVRLGDGSVLATFQYTADTGGAGPSHEHGASPARVARSTGGLVQMNERGVPIRSGGASDPAIPDRHIYPYAVVPIPALDRAVSTTTDMNEGNTEASSEWVQFWRLSDLTLLRSVALQPGPRGNEHQFSGEPRLLQDGKSVYIHTFNCGLYLVQGIDSHQPTSRFLMAFEGSNCGVPVLSGNYWLQTVPDAHAVVALDISDPERPRQVSTMKLGDDEHPHWIAIDKAGRRVAINSAGRGSGNRLFIADFDPASGSLVLDERFRDAGAPRPGVSFAGKTWPHGFAGTAIPHGTVFSR